MATVAVVGATGGIGTLVVDGLIDAGHAVRALARRPEAVRTHEHVTPIGGDVRDRDAVDRLVDGADVVLSCLGNDRLGPMVTCTGTARILDAMDAAGVQRIAVISSIGVGDSRAQGWKVSKLFMALVVPTVLRKPFADLEDMEQLVRQRRPDHGVIVRPVGLTNGPATGDFAAVGTDARLGWQIPRADVATFLIGLVDDRSHDGQAVSLGPVR
jgi:uncharacterized protein YbjT (DUF2867 family)